MSLQLHLDFNEDTDHELKSLPRITVTPTPHPSFPPLAWTPPEGAVLAATQQFNNEEWMPRTYFGPGFGSLHCVATAPRELFFLFLNQIRYDTTSYIEGLVPWKSRYPLIGKLLAEGYIYLMRVGAVFSKDSVFYLVPAPMAPILTCMDLSHEKRWDASYCCSECHKDFRLFSDIEDRDLSKPFTSNGGPEGRKVFVCCRASILLTRDWYYGKIYRLDELPEHDW
jgi:hypothetical protein